MPAFSRLSYAFHAWRAPSGAHGRSTWKPAHTVESQTTTRLFTRVLEAGGRGSFLERRDEIRSLNSCAAHHELNAPGYSGGATAYRRTDYLMVMIEHAEWPVERMLAAAQGPFDGRQSHSASPRLPLARTHHHVSAFDARDVQDDTMMLLVRHHGSPASVWLH